MAAAPQTYGITSTYEKTNSGYNDADLSHYYMRGGSSPPTSSQNNHCPILILSEVFLGYQTTV